MVLGCRGSGEPRTPGLRANTTLCALDRPPLPSRSARGGWVSIRERGLGQRSLDGLKDEGSNMIAE